MNLSRLTCLAAAYVVISLQCSAALVESDASLQKKAVAARTLFFQTNFNRFVPVQFEKSTNSLAPIQYLKVKGNTFDYDGKHYCGFKFTVPEWIDGDFKWIHVLAKTEAQKDFFAQHLQWYIIPEIETMDGFEEFYHCSVGSSYYLSQLFPYTKEFITQSLDRGSLTPGATYAIWFGYEEADLPDIAFALTIDSPRGLKEFGDLIPRQNPPNWRSH